jgi:hypothetical protein
MVLWNGALDGWSAYAAQDSAADVGVAADGALRFLFTLSDATSWAIARRDVDLTLPASWVMTLRIRGEAEPNELQVKLVDASGENVWWWRRPDVVLSPDPRRLLLRRVTLDFAWGPASGGEPSRLSAVEVAIAAGKGGAGFLAIDDLRIEPRAPAPEPPRGRSVRASSSVVDHDARHVLDADPRTTWRPLPGDRSPSLELDLGREREWGGLIVRFVGASPACRVAVSDDGVRWTPIAEEPAANAEFRWVAAGEAESRFVRLELADAAEIADVAVVPIELAVSPVRWAAALARAAPRGCFPRHLLGEQVPWTVVGGDGDGSTALLGQDGALEVAPEAFTVEPFLWSAGRLFTWADVETVPSLAERCLPIPSVEWIAGDLRLRITAFRAGLPDQPRLVACYVVENRSDAMQHGRLLLALRPFQVLPAWQRLNVSPAVAPIRCLEEQDGHASVDGRRDFAAVTVPDGFGAAASREGLQGVFDGGTPAGDRVDDPLGFVEGVLAYELHLPPGGADEIVVAVAPAHAAPARLNRPAAAAWARERLDETTAWWRARLARIPVELPPSAAAVSETLRASIAWILVNRDGPRIQPGARCYRRSWIRDGTLTGTALAEMGFAEEARAFLRWYAPHQADDGRVPCAVDRRGVDPVAEHDSHGQLVWGAVELYRLTGDRAFLDELWPRVLRAVGAIERLRDERTGQAFLGSPYFGLLPASISHEGYASRPVHSYWDDFFALRALSDAAWAATVVGDGVAAGRIGALRDAMRADVHASIGRAMAEHGIDFVPGSAELGDFDPTSTAIAFDPCGEAEGLPRAALEATFERYWREVMARDERPPAAYAPYEIRNVLAFIGLGWKERALTLLDRFVADQRPCAWRQWPEIAWSDRRAPRFLGDLPHGWVASTFVRTVRRMIAWERADGALVVGAGVPEAWVREAPGLRVHGLATHHGPLGLTMRADGDGCVRVVFTAGLRPPGGIVLSSPSPRPLRSVHVDGRPQAVAHADRVRLAAAPAEVVLLY